MKVIEFYGRGQPVFSFEFFLPKTPESKEAFFNTLRELKALAPHFVTLTYGATGSARDQTVEMAGIIRNQFKFETVMHLTSITHTKSEIEAIARRVRALDIENIMALRGDVPQSGEVLPLEQREYKYGRDLVAHLKKMGGWCIGVGGYPEGHPECSSKEEDLKHLKEKADAGADFITTQLFFDNKEYFNFIAEARGIGIKQPLVPGIMPITNYKQIQKFTTMCGVKIPGELRARLEPVEEDAGAIINIGIEHATRQCLELLKGGAPGLHFYTLNRSQATTEILKRVRQKL